MKADVAAFLDRVVGWAAAREDVRLAMLIGSQARAEAPADVWSDVDLVLGVRAPDRLLDRNDWLNALGGLAITYVEPTPIGGQRERRVLFADGLDVDCTILLAEHVHVLLAEPDVATALGHGCRVLVDKDGHGTALQAVPAHHTDPVLPNQEEFDTLVSDFWYHAVWAARKLARGEVWIATQCCNGHMQRLLVQTWAYQVQLGQGAARRTWYGGRFLEKWADPTMLAAFRDTVSAYDETVLRRALVATMDAFAMSAREVAAKRGLTYRDGAEEAARHWVAAALGPEGGHRPTA